jgi:hypothetical protein
LVIFKINGAKDSEFRVGRWWRAEQLDYEKLVRFTGKNRLKTKKVFLRLVAQFSNAGLREILSLLAFFENDLFVYFFSSIRL